MGFLSKIAKGLKGIVKGAAKGIKKIAKKVVYAVPGGEKLWKEGGRLGTKIIKGIGKVTNALGPIGMIALSVLAPYAAPLWSSFGAASAAAGGFLGSIGTAVYSAGNWVAGTISSMTSGISKAVGTIADGGFKGLANGSLSKAGSQAVNGFANAFTGKAGAAGVNAGVQAASDFAFREAAGQTLMDQTINKIKGDVVGTGLTEFSDGAATNFAEQNMGGVGANLGGGAQMAPNLANVGTTLGGDAAATNAFAPISSTVGKVGVGLGNKSLAAGAATVGKAMLKGDSETLGYSSQLSPIGDVGGRTFGGAATSQGGMGSRGGNFLSNSMLTAMQAQQERMTRGF